MPEGRNLECGLCRGKTGVSRIHSPLIAYSDTRLEMTYPTPKDIEQTLQALRERSEAVKGNPELAREFLERLEERPLSKQPELTPLQRSERLLHSNGGDMEAESGPVTAKKARQ